MARFLPVLVLLAVVAAAAPAEAAPPGYDIRGAWQGVAASSAFSGTVTFDANNCATGEFSGSAASGGTTFPAGGRVDGTSVSLTIGPFSKEPGDSASGTGSFVDANRITGKFRDNEGFKDTPGDFQLVRQSGPPDDGLCLLKRPTVVRVSCDYNVATSIDTCTATVGDASAAPTTPSGSVRFTAAAGVFSPGDTCTLESSPVAPATASCDVQYRAPSGPRTYPEVTATYSGDAAHAENSGKTQYLALSGPLPFGSPAPGTLELEVNVPADGTKVEACALVAASAVASGSAVLRQFGPSLTKVLADVNRIITRLRATTPAGSVKTTAEAQALVDRAAGEIQRANAEVERLRGSSNADDLARAAELQRDLAKLFEALANIQKAYHDQCMAPIRNLRSVLPGAVAAKTRSKAVRLGYAPARSARRGALKLKLRVSKAALRKAARGRSRVTVYIRVNQVLPSRVLKRGWPRATVRKVVLTRDGRLAK